MQRIFNLSKWRTIAEGELMRFSGEQARKVRLEVNAKDKVRFFVVEPGNDPLFLALVDGRDTIEFAVDGAFDLTITGGEASIYTADGADWTVAEVDGKTFTRIVERRVRNPELEYMMALARQNMEARLDAQSAELERRMAQFVASGNASAASAAATVGVADESAAGGGAPSAAPKAGEVVGAPDIRDSAAPKGGGDVVAS